MADRLFAVVKTTMAYRNCLRLGEHLAVQAVNEGVLPSSNEERKALGLKEIPGRKLRQINAAAASNSKELAVQRQESSALATLSSVAERPMRLASVEVLDCTFGGGQHTRKLLDAGDPFVRVVAMDCDDATRLDVKEIEDEFGSHRFRFVQDRFTNIARLFGESLFDVVVVDPGPNASQLFDPARGFLLGTEGEDPVHSGCNHNFDLRYGKCFKTPALEWLNTEDGIATATAISDFGLVEFNTAMRTVQALKRRRPLQGSLDVLRVIEQELGPLHEDGWLCTERLPRTPMSMRFLFSLRSAINSEKVELQRGLDQAVDVLKPDGLLVVFTRFPWEAKVIKDVLGEHPCAVQVGRENISMEDVEEYGFPPSTTMWSFRRTNEDVASAAGIRNGARAIPEEEIQASELARMLQLGGTQRNQYPAWNFTNDARSDPPKTRKRERETIRRNAKRPEDISGMRF